MKKSGNVLSDTNKRNLIGNNGNMAVRFFNGGYLDYLKCDDVKVEIKQIECEKPQVDLTEDEIDALMEKEYALLTEDEKKAERTTFENVRV